MSMAIEEEKKRQRIVVWGKRIVKSVSLLMSCAVLTFVIYINYQPILQPFIEILEPKNKFTMYETSQGHQVVLTKVGRSEYFDQADIRILKPGNWIITLITEKGLKGNKPQAIACTVHLEEMGNYTFNPPDDVKNTDYGKKFIWLTPKVDKLASGKGVSILITNLNPIRNISIVEFKLDYNATVWELREMPKMSQSDL